MNCFNRAGDGTEIIGFEDLIGRKVKITLHGEGITISPCTDESDVSCLYLNTETFSKPVVRELLEQYRVFDHQFLRNDAGVYNPVMRFSPQ